ATPVRPGADDHIREGLDAGLPGIRDRTHRVAQRGRHRRLGPARLSDLRWTDRTDPAGGCARHLCGGHDRGHLVRVGPRDARLRAADQLVTSRRRTGTALITTNTTT